MSLTCPICEGDERFCKEHGCQDKPSKPCIIVSDKQYLELKDHLKEIEGKTYYDHPSYGRIEVQRSNLPEKYKNELKLCQRYYEKSYETESN